MSKKIFTMILILAAASFTASVFTSCATVPPEPLPVEEPPPEPVVEVYIPEPPPQELPSFEPNEFELRVFELVNAERRFRRLPPLVWHNSAFIAARLHSMDMHDSNIMRHTGSDGSNTGQRLERIYIGNLTSWSASIAGGWLTPEAVVDAWMESPIYRQNILREDFVYTGVGFLQRPADSNSRFPTYWTQKFFTLD